MCNSLAGKALLCKMQKLHKGSVYLCENANVAAHKLHI